MGKRKDRPVEPPQEPPKEPAKKQDDGVLLHILCALLASVGLTVAILAVGIGVTAANGPSQAAAPSSHQGAMPTVYIAPTTPPAAKPTGEPDGPGAQQTEPAQEPDAVQTQAPAAQTQNPAQTQAAQAPAQAGNQGGGESNITNEITGPLNRTAYWVNSGYSYHFSAGCRSLARSTNIHQGTLQDALNAGKTDPCNNCAGG